MAFSHILICVDGEPHTEAALALAIDLAKTYGARLEGLYVVDPYLKKFTHEIYAVNRDQCREHLDRSLAAEGEAALADLVARAGAAGIAAGHRLEYGPPEDVIPELLAKSAYDLVILGGKRFGGRLARWSSRDLPSRLDGRLPVPVLLVRV